MSKCECATCGLSFKSVSGFDRHRVGSYELDKRRCLTEEELIKLGFVEKDNIWRQPMPETMVRGLYREI